MASSDQSAPSEWIYDISQAEANQYELVFKTAPNASLRSVEKAKLTKALPEGGALAPTAHEASKIAGSMYRKVRSHFKSLRKDNGDRYARAYYTVVIRLLSEDGTIEREDKTKIIQYPEPDDIGSGSGGSRGDPVAGAVLNPVAQFTERLLGTLSSSAHHAARGQEFSLKVYNEGLRMKDEAIELQTELRMEELKNERRMYAWDRFRGMMRDFNAEWAPVIGDLLTVNSGRRPSAEGGRSSSDSWKRNARTVVSNWQHAWTDQLCAESALTPAAITLMLQAFRMAANGNYAALQALRSQVSIPAGDRGPFLELLRRVCGPEVAEALEDLMM